MNFMVTGGTGTVGSRVVEELLSREAGTVRVLTRDAGREMPEGAEAVEGDLQEPETVRSVFDGIDGLFLLNAVSPTETHEGLMAVNGAMMAGVKRIAYLSVHRVDEAPHLPHFGSKIAVEAALRDSGIPTTVLRANNFFQNDVWFREAVIQHGVYPQPIGGVGLSRVDVRDIAEVAASALVDGGLEDETVGLVGPEIHTGNSTAAVWMQALDLEVAYAGDDLDAWAEQAAEQMPDWMVFDFRLMYEFFQHNGLQAEEGEVERLTEILGHPPRSFHDYAAEMAESWL